MNDTVLNQLKKINDFSSADKSFSPFYSNIGLEVNLESDGAGALWLHYNRSSRRMWNSFIYFPLSQNKEQSMPWCVSYGKGEKTAALTFFETDAVLFNAEGLERVGLFSQPDEKLQACWIEDFSKTDITLRGYSYNTDDRDPDETVPFVACAKIINGSFSLEGEKLYAEAENGELLFGIAFRFLDELESAAENALVTPRDFKKGCENCLNTYLYNISSFDLEPADERTAFLAAKALHGLGFNLKRAPGRLSKHISSYPSRGAYPTHFLWDTCFQNLAYEKINPKLAKEFLLQIAECQRNDGKYEQFICSTWGRPHYSQPALVGAAVKRLADADFDKAFVEAMLPSLEKNNSWWLNSRIAKNGLIFCPHGLETGQDDSPRFDNGTTYSCDMNAYVLCQLNATADLFEMTGNKTKASFWRTKAEKLSEAMLTELYCEEENIFYDKSPETGEFIRIVSPVSLLPLWAGIKLSDSKARAMLEKYLLSPEYLFGTVPFPSVAYNEKEYKSDGWWRGPTWMPEAWLMLETLKKFGYEKEYREALQRLLAVLKADGEMHELFDSKSGRGLGACEQGWTNAIFIRLLYETENADNV